MKKLIILMLGVLIFSALLESCLLQKTIKIGYIANMTGTSSDFGVVGRNGLLLLVKNINNAGGIKNRKIEIIIRDSQNNSNSTLLEAVDLYTNLKIKIIILHTTSNAAKDVIPWANEHDVLLLSPTVSSNIYTGLDDNFIRLSPPSNIYGEKIADYIIKTKLKSIAILYDSANAAYSNSFIDGIIKSFNRVDKRNYYLYDYSTGGNESFISIAKKAVSKNPEGIVIIANSHDTAAISQSLHKINYRGVKFGSTWAMTEDLLKNGGRTVENMIIINIVDVQFNLEPYRSFYEMYISLYNTPPTAQANAAYEMAFILFEALKNTGSWTTKKLKDYILATSEFQGLQSTINFDKFGDNYQNLFFFKIKNGKYQRIQ